MPPKKKATAATPPSARRLKAVTTEEAVDNITGVFKENGKGKGRRDNRAALIGAGKVARPVSSEDNPKINFTMNQKWSQIIRDVRDGLYTWEEFVESLDAEEIARGQLKDINGSFTGRPNTLVPKAFHDACMRELTRRFDTRMREQLLSATEELIRLAAHPEMDLKDRAKLLQYFIERVVGPVPKDVRISATPGYEHDLQGIVNTTEDAAEAKPRDRYAKRRRQLGEDEDKEF